MQIETIFAVGLQTCSSEGQAFPQPAVDINIYKHKFRSIKFSYSNYVTADVQTQEQKMSSWPRREEVITAGKLVDLLT
jgi:hypothetical protein